MVKLAHTNLPDKKFNKDSLDNILDGLGVPKKDQSYATRDTVKKLAEKRLLEYFYTGESEKGQFKNDPDSATQYLSKIKSNWGVTPDDLIVEQAPDGRMQLVFSPEVVQKIMDYTGIVGMYATTGANSAPTVLGGATPGMQSITQRVFTGLFKFGGKGKTGAMSQDSDMQTGGADFAYVRPIRKGNDPDSYGKRIIIDPYQVLKRLDIFAYPEDMWGVKNPKDSRWTKYLGKYGAAGQPDMLKEAAENDINGMNPEIMVRHNIPLAAIQGYLFSSEISRLEVLKALKDAGITHVNGIPVEEFLKNTNNKKWFDILGKDAK